MLIKTKLIIATLIAVIAIILTFLVGCGTSSPASSGGGGTPPPPAPLSITSIYPASVSAGSQLFIGGTGLDRVTHVTINGASASFGGYYSGTLGPGGTTITTCTLGVTVPASMAVGPAKIVVIDINRAASASLPPTITCDIVSPPPTGVTATASGPTQININWATSAGLTYNIYRSNTANQPLNVMTKINPTPVAVGPFANTGLIPKTTYYYKITSVNAVGSESLPSAEVNAATGNPWGTNPPPAFPHVTPGGLANNWVLQAGSTSDLLHSIVWSGTKFVAVGGRTISTSPDGVTWTPQFFPAPYYLRSVTWSGTQFVAVGDSGLILTSPDGVTWTLQISGTITTSLLSVSWSGSQFIAVGGDLMLKTNNIILTSPDGIIWTQRTSGTTQPLYSVIWSGMQYVTVGYNGLILTSPDGIVWTQKQSGTLISLNSIVWSGTNFVAVGGDIRGAVAVTSLDGNTWTPIPQISGTGAAWNSITWSGTQYVVVGGLGIISSPDGIVWTTKMSPLTSPTINVLYSIVWSGTKFVVGCNIGDVLTSP